MKSIEQNVPVSFTYNIHFTSGLFEHDNALFSDTVTKASAEVARKVLFVIDAGVSQHHPDLKNQIKSYAKSHADAFQAVNEIQVIPGGEAVKNDPTIIDQLHEAINAANLDRHSYVAAIGGGAVLDAVGYAAGTAHRGIRLIRIPTTVLAQNDAGIGVKNGVNAFGKKNFLGTFAPPFAVLNDFSFLNTLDQRDWRSGISEAVKVALLKDADFFEFLEDKATALDHRAPEAMHHLIYRCAELHLEHIATSGDPFEMGSSRPLDFGHWSAHKLEQITDYELRHGEAVAIGLALDCIYSQVDGLLSEEACQRVLTMLRNAGYKLFIPELEHKIDAPENPESIFHGLEEFREHLGGELTIMLLEEIGTGREVHEVDYDVYREAISELKAFEEQRAQV
ncbi:3-dehydroquinate synthase [Fodinibius salsisoli]|uniref:3-dehydroquinate synthase n=1 Tax=Fodinibius salsisoli TaxID=2820877 RepID=A0ABT3PPL2_9BACT|nr:3-dehydroquinate synthase [Fodinibius salsisoli]MCW9707804.1 3-dehydroquinate synthase [Fodinibius salsisoli]